MSDTIYRVNEKLDTTTKIESLNDMIMDLDGRIVQSQFNKTEIDELYSGTGLDRRYYRDEGLGNTSSGEGWSHFYANSGYSIWSYTPTNYKHSSENKVYLDDKELINMGEALSTSSTFDYVFAYDGLAYIDNTTEAGTSTGVAFNGMAVATTDFIYVGLDSQYTGVAFTFNTRGSNYTLKIEYYGTAGWTTLSSSANTLVDNTEDFIRNGTVTFIAPSDWILTTINSLSKYWIRFSTTTTPVTTATIYSIIPANNVIGLLMLSSEQVIDEDWAWCSYNGNIYVTLRNTGNNAYEGDYYVTSSSTTINKQNFFVYNHGLTADYENSAYVGATGSGIMFRATYDQDGDNIVDYAEGIKSYNTIRFLADDFYTPTISGASSSSTTFSTGNRAGVEYYSFSPNSENVIHCNVLMPKDWDLNTLKARFMWMAHNTGANSGAGVVWGIQGVCLKANDVATNVGWSTLTNVSDTTVTPYQLKISSGTPSFSPSGSGILSRDGLYSFRVKRLVTHTNDAMNAFADLIGIELQYYTDTIQTTWI